MTDFSKNCQPPDAAARRQALDIGHSYIVQAPAGSGKTELLIQRILALLARVDRPEEVLAITFTRKAAGEMLERLLGALQRAENPLPPDENHQKTTWEHAVLALRQDRNNSWNLLSNPSRLQIMTIDSFCSGLSRKMPWLTRLGDQPSISDDPESLYRQAAEQFLSAIETGGPGKEDVALLLRHLDNRLDRLRDLLVGMLARRDQWLRHVMTRQSKWRPELERSLDSHVRSELSKTADLVGARLLEEALELGYYAACQLAENGVVSPLAILQNKPSFNPEDPAQIDIWLALCHLCLTGNGTIRKTVNKNLGFVAGNNGDAPYWKERMLNFLQMLEERSLAGPLSDILNLPAPHYSDRQWHILEALIRSLPLAVVGLRNVFRQSGTVDFIEIAGAALAGLGAVDAPGDLLLKLDNSISHILVDEFQDTSHAQYELLRKLTSGWVRGDGRTLYLVGDPMQSIYLFREADVGLFLRVRQSGLGEIPLRKLSLTANFRSSSALVGWFNRTFGGLFPAFENELTGAVTYHDAAPVRIANNDPAVLTHIYNERQDQSEAETVLQLVRQAKNDDPDGTCAILVRSRTHLSEIIKILKRCDIHFQAQDVDSLASRTIIFDLLALTRALLYPCDRVAWLSVLRAPWCGLCLSDLLQLADHDKNVSLLTRIERHPVQQEMFAVLSQDGQERLEKIRSVLSDARELRGKIRLAKLIETTWLRLGGPGCTDSQGLADASQFFNLLDTLDDGGDLVSMEELVHQLELLYAAPDPNADSSLQVMTVHKAKGLEFDTVILPGLGRTIRRRERQLLQWLEKPDMDLLLAPIPAVDDEDDSTYRAIGTILQQREDNELLRLVYVAATRARKRLHLLGCVRNADDPSPAPGSLLHALWPSLENEQLILISSPQDVGEENKPLPFIRRLSVASEIPSPEASRSVKISGAIARASEVATLTSNGQAYTLRTEEGRIIGTVIHRWMERLATDGIDLWKSTDPDRLHDRLSAQLHSHGIPQSRLHVCTDKTLNYIGKVISSEKAGWFLGAREEGRCELGLSGVVGGQLMHASVDRTFVDNGTRWVVDYKTTSPGPGESLEAFLDKEVAKYRPQLDIYMQLMSAVDNTNRIKGALYFPAIDVWHEVPGP